MVRGERDRVNYYLFTEREPAADMSLGRRNTLAEKSAAPTATPSRVCDPVTLEKYQRSFSRTIDASR
jgi:hypothetical protein